MDLDIDMEFDEDHDPWPWCVFIMSKWGRRNLAYFADERDAHNWLEDRITDARRSFALTHPTWPTKDPVTAETLQGMLKKAGRTVERAAKHDEFGNDTLWEISRMIKQEADRILKLGGEPF